MLFLYIDLVSNNLPETCLLLWFIDPLRFFLNIDNLLCEKWEFYFFQFSYYTYASFSCVTAFSVSPIHRLESSSLTRIIDEGLLWLFGNIYGKSFHWLSFDFYLLFSSHSDIILLCLSYVKFSWRSSNQVILREGQGEVWAVFLIS